MQVVNLQQRASLQLGHFGCVHYTSVAHVELFHRLYVAAINRRWHVSGTQKRSHLAEFDFRERNHRNCLWNRRKFCVRIFLKQLPELKVFIDRCALFVYRSIIVVRCAVGRVSFVICASPMGERCSAVSHVERERDVIVEHRLDAIDHGVGRSCLVSRAPSVEPSAPIFRAHQRCIGTHLLYFLKLLQDIRVGSKIHSPKKVVESIVGKIARPVALKKLHLVESRLSQNIAYSRNIRLILSVRAVFVLNLNHYNRSAVFNRQRSELLAHFLLENSHSLKKIRVLLAEFDIFLLQKPPRKSAHLPLSTDVRTGADNYEHSVFLSQTTEFGNIVLARKIEFTFLLFVNIPEYIQAQSIHSQSLAHFYSVFPIWSWNSRIMNFGCFDNKRLAVHQKCSFSNFKRMRDNIVLGTQRRSHRCCNKCE